VGQYGAYTPWDGSPESCWQDAAGKLIRVVHTRAAEGRRPGVDGADALVRRLGRAASPAGALALSLPKNPTEADDVDCEALLHNREGIVVFDAGAYSAGPATLGVYAPPPPEAAAAADEAEAAAAAAAAAAPARPPALLAATPIGGGPSAGISVVEQCLAWSDGSRRRLRVTLKAAPPGPDNGGELDVEARARARCPWERAAGGGELGAPPPVPLPSVADPLPHPTPARPPARPLPLNVT